MEGSQYHVLQIHKESFPRNSMQHSYTGKPEIKPGLD
jgi:hypothetical protein